LLIDFNYILEFWQVIFLKIIGVYYIDIIWIIGRHIFIKCCFCVVFTVNSIIVGLITWREIFVIINNVYAFCIIVGITIGAALSVVLITDGIVFIEEVLFLLLNNVCIRISIYVLS
jgi:hypothetical protein